MSEISDIHAPFIKWLREQGIPYVNPRSDQKSGIAEGHPDFTLLYGNRVLLIEMKEEKGALSTKQVKRIAELEAVGCKVHVVRSAGVAIELAAAWRSMIGVEVLPARREAPAEQLYQYGAGVWRKDAHGAATLLRPLTPADHNLPKLQSK